MPFNTQFLKLMPNSVSWSTMTGFDSYAAETYSTEVHTAWARVETDPRLIKDSFGADVVLTHTVYVASTSTIPATAQITVDGAQPHLLHVEQAWDATGLHHQVLYFG